MDGLLLLSGSKDCTARVWDVPSKQCLRVLEHKGCVDNVQIHPRSPYLDGQRSKSSLPVLGVFKRSLHSLKETSDSNDQGQGAECVPIRIFSTNFLKSDEERNSMDNNLLESVLKENCYEDHQGGGQLSLTKVELEEQLEKSKQLNQTLYQFAVDELLTEVRDELRNEKNT